MTAPLDVGKVKPYNAAALDRARALVAKHGAAVELDGLHLARLLATLDTAARERETLRGLLKEARLAIGKDEIDTGLIYRIDEATGFAALGADTASLKAGAGGG